MESLKRLIAIVIAAAMFQFTVSLVTEQPARADSKKGLRTFYLTKDFHDGSQALTACAPGFHMASLWEIFDPSNLRYDATLGFTRDDSGSGPPQGSFGWIRTGTGATTSNFAGVGNCNAWQSNAPSTAAPKSSSRTVGRRACHRARFTPGLAQSEPGPKSNACGAWRINARRQACAHEALICGVRSSSQLDMVEVAERRDHAG